MLLIASIPSARAADGAGSAGAGAQSGGAETAKALAAVERVLKGERVSDLDLKGLENAVIRLESSGPAAGLQTGTGVEGTPGEKMNVQRNIYILRFDSGGGAERQIQLLRIQREILRNQLVLLKALNTVATHQALLGTKTARVENTMKDMVLGMKASRSEMHKVRGETAGTGAKVTDIAGATADMSVSLTDMAKSIDDIEGTIKDVDVEIARLAGSVEDQGSAMQRGMKKMGKGIESEIQDLKTDMQMDMKSMQRDLEIGGVQGPQMGGE
jgi:hypothetical protein